MADKHISAAPMRRVSCSTRSGGEGGGAEAHKLNTLPYVFIYVSFSFFSTCSLFFEFAAIITKAVAGPAWTAGASPTC